MAMLEVVDAQIFGPRCRWGPARRSPLARRLLGWGRKRASSSSFAAPQGREHAESSRKLSIEAILWAAKASSQLIPGAERALKAQEQPLPALAGGWGACLSLARAGGSGS